MFLEEIERRWGDCLRYIFLIDHDGRGVNKEEMMSLGDGTYDMSGWIQQQAAIKSEHEARGGKW
jgi:hypothetical protein